tara:strand:- start:146 stop:370 length:225 start_codon:yes stop_codon:yes gene_type:complete
MKIADCNPEELIAKRYLSKIAREKYKKAHPEELKKYQKDYGLKYYHKNISQPMKKATILRKLKIYNDNLILTII